MSDPSVEQEGPRGGAPSASAAGTEASPRSGDLPEPDYESPGAEGRAEPGVPAPPDTNTTGTQPLPPQGDRVDQVPENTGGGRGRGAAVPDGEQDAVRAARGPDDGGSTDDTSGSPQVLPGTAPRDDRPQVDASAGTSERDISETPRSDGVGRASRTPGDVGRPPQPLETDMRRGAARTAPGGPPGSTPPPADAPGDAHGVSVNDTHAMLGTSERSAEVHGVRTPQGADGSDPDARPSPGAPGQTASSAAGAPGGPSVGSTAGSASATATARTETGLPDPAAQPRSLADTGADVEDGSLEDPAGTHVTRESGPRQDGGALVGRRSSPDGEVGTT